MSEKNPVSVNISDRNKERTGEPGVNRSGLVDRLLTEYFEGDGDTSELVLSLRIEEVENEIEEIESMYQTKLEAKRRELEQLKEREESLTGIDEDALEKANDRFLKMGPWSVTVKNLNYWSGEVGVTPHELIEELPDFEHSDFTDEIRDQCFEEDA